MTCVFSSNTKLRCDLVYSFPDDDRGLLLGGARKQRHEVRFPWDALSFFAAAI